MSKKNNNGRKSKNLRKRENRKKLQEEIKNTKKLITEMQKNNEQTAKANSKVKTTVANTNKNQAPEVKQQNYPKKKYKYIIPAKKVGISSSTLNQFVCLACHSINLVEESIQNETELYGDKDTYCRVCQNVTPQICIKDKTLTKTRLEMTTQRTPYEERAYQALINKTNEINKPTQKRKTYSSKGSKK